MKYSNVERFIDKAKRYSNIEELSPELLRLFIEKIVVGEKAEKYSRTAEQKIWIHYRDVGLMDTPFEDSNATDDFSDIYDFDEDDELDAFDGFILEPVAALASIEQTA